VVSNSTMVSPGLTISPVGRRNVIGTSETPVGGTIIISELPPCRSPRADTLIVTCPLRTVVVGISLPGWSAIVARNLRVLHVIPTAAPAARAMERRINPERFTGLFISACPSRWDQPKQPSRPWRDQILRPRPDCGL